MTKADIAREITKTTGFIVKIRAEKAARNISRNTTIIIPAHNIPASKLSNSFKEEVAIK